MNQPKKITKQIIWEVIEDKLSQLFLNNYPSQFPLLTDIPKLQSFSFAIAQDDQQYLTATSETNWRNNLLGAGLNLCRTFFFPLFFLLAPLLSFHLLHSASCRTHWWSTKFNSNIWNYLTKKVTWSWAEDQSAPTPRFMPYLQVVRAGNVISPIVMNQLKKLPNKSSERWLKTNFLFSSWSERQLYSRLYRHLEMQGSFEELTIRGSSAPNASPVDSFPPRIFLRGDFGTKVCGTFW